MSAKVFTRFRNGMVGILILISNFGCEDNQVRNPDQGDAISTLDQETALIHDGLRLSIREMVWHEDQLKLVIHTALSPDAHSSTGRDKWAFDPSWVFVYVHFWDHQERKLDYEAEVTCFHSEAFRFKTQLDESHSLLVDVPLNAAYLTVQYGTGPWFTKCVSIPPKR